MTPFKAKLNGLLERARLGEPIAERDKVAFLHEVFGEGITEGRKRQRQELKEKLIKGEINVSISVEGL